MHWKLRFCDAVAQDFKHDLIRHMYIVGKRRHTIPSIYCDATTLFVNTVWLSPEVFRFSSLLDFYILLRMRGWEVDTDTRTRAEWNFAIRNKCNHLLDSSWYEIWFVPLIIIICRNEELGVWVGRDVGCNLSWRHKMWNWAMSSLQEFLPSTSPTFYGSILNPTMKLNP
jgi:hypothetical protein